jgi:hypothetical protein
MEEILKTYVDQINISVNVPIQLPKIKKEETLKTPKLKLPKLKPIK